MRVLNIIQCTNLGGMERSNLLRLVGLKARGHSVELISLNPLGKLAPLLDDAGIPAVGLDYRGRFGWRSWPSQCRLFRANNPDAILMTGHNLVAAMALANVSEGRKILAIHCYHFEPGARSWHWPLVYSVADRVFDHITFASEFIRREALMIRPSLERKSSVLPNPFELPPEVFSSERLESRQRFGIPNGAKVVGNAGWLLDRKRFDIFLRVAAKVLTKRSNITFLIAGDGPERKNLTTLAARLGIENNIRFLGWQPDLGDFYRSLDVMLFNTDFDALGRTPVEAASFGVPVVASVVHGGLKEVFRSEEEAVVLGEHDIDRLSEAVLQTLADPIAQKDRGRKARERVAEYGRMDRHAEEMERLLFG